MENDVAFTYKTPCPIRPERAWVTLRDVLTTNLTAGGGEIVAFEPIYDTGLAAAQAASTSWYGGRQRATYAQIVLLRQRVIFFRSTRLSEGATQAHLALSQMASGFALRGMQPKPACVKA